MIRSTNMPPVQEVLSGEKDWLLENEVDGRHGGLDMSIYVLAV
ncbi:hypothetical protein NYE48_27035 [Paenibacillus sp. FSL M7-1455]